MGGGGSSSNRLRDRDEGKVRKEIEKAKGRRNLFISFAHEDIDTVNMFRGQAKSDRSDVDFVDRSVKEPFDSVRDDYIKQQISRRIKQASMTAVYLSDATAGSKWVDWEIRRSLDLGREVVAFHPKKSRPKDLPPAIKEFGIKVIPWSRLSKELEPED